MLIDFRFNLSSQDLSSLTKCPDKLHILRVWAVIIHFSLGISSLEVEADVVQSYIGFSFTSSLRKVVSPQSTACVKDCCRFW